MSKKPILYLVACNHFDLAWRRPFRTNMDNKGETFIPYAKIEQYYIEDNMALCDKYPEYKFCIESVSVVREFLKNRPDLKDKLFSLAKEGKAFIPGSGDVIVDSNLILGETIIRNYLTGLLWAEDNFNQKNRQAFRADAFGNSSQLPQIFKGCELDHVMSLDYAIPDGVYWRGLDGSTVVCAYHANCGNGGNPYKLTPCLKCKGTGEIDGEVCTECKGRGINSEREKEFYFPFQVNEKLLEAKGVGYIRLAPEEYLPKEEVILRARELSKKYDVRFVNTEETLDHFNDLFENIDNVAVAQLNSSTELNPGNTGCYVSRIQSKQIMRRQEYDTLAAETLSSWAWILNGNYPKEELLDVWYDLFYMAFHDCITGTVVDPAYEELVQDRIKIDENISKVRNNALKSITAPNDKTITVLNPFGFAKSDIVELEIPEELDWVSLVDTQTKEKLEVVSCDIKDGKTLVKALIKELNPFSAKKLTWKKARALNTKAAKDSVIENSRYKITADEHGIVSVYDKKLMKELAENAEYRFGEFVLEHDEGTPWSTLSSDCKRYPLAKHTKLISTEIGKNYQRFTFELNPVMRYDQQDVKGKTTVTLWEGIDRIDFHSDLKWDSFNHRLRVAFPVKLNGKNMYGVPYGYMSRNSYTPKYNWTSIDGDYPAINWAGVDNGEESIAVINRGIPSYKIEQETRSTHMYVPHGSVIFLSVLRSPTIPTFLHEPGYYSAYNWDGIRDAGVHHFDYSVCAYDTSFADSNIEAESQSFNNKFVTAFGDITLPNLPEIVSENAYVSTIKLAEKTDGLIVRLAEYRGKNGEVQIKVPQWASGVECVNMLERHNEAVEICDNIAKLNVRPFQIVTLLFKKK